MIFSKSLSIFFLILLMPNKALSAPQEFLWGAGGHYQQVVGDFNNDGQVDVGLRDASSGQWSFAFSNGSDWFHNTRNFVWASGEHFQPFVGDFNNDGLVDIGLRDTSNGQWHFAFFNGNDWYHNTRNFSWAAGGHFQPLVGDFNNDGLIDIGLRDTSNGQWHFAIFNGIDWYQNTRNYSWAQGNHFQPLVGDFNNDGLTDIGLRDASNGQWHFAFFNGNNWYDNTRTFSWTPGAHFQSQVGDFNGDGVLDAVLRDTNTGTWSFEQELLPQTSIGIFYSLWHCPHRNPVYDISKAVSGQEPWGPIPAFHWREEPALGYYCLSEDVAVLQQHAIMLRDAGIDFVFLDGTNHGSVESNDRTEEMILKPLAKLLDVWKEIEGAPKVVAWAPLPILPLGEHQTLRVMVEAIDQAQLSFEYLGKPLVLVTGNNSTAVDQDAFVQLEANHTMRKMAGFLLPDDSTNWSFLEQCQVGFRDNPWSPSNPSGKACKQRSSYQSREIEQVSITAAYQETYISDTRTAVPKNYGDTLRAQFKTLMDNPKATIATITSWNEWIAQRNYCPGTNCRDADSFPNGNKVFVDVYDEEYSRDVEPSLGGRGAYYYDLMRSCIAIYRRGESCGAHNANELCCIGG